MLQNMSFQHNVTSSIYKDNTQFTTHWAKRGMTLNTIKSTVWYPLTGS